MLEFSKRLLSQVKKRLRETGTDFDEEIISHIESCATDLNDAGILLSFFIPGDDTWRPDPQILQAVRLYCLANHGLYNSDMEKYDKAYRSLKSTLCTQRKYTEADYGI